MLREGEMEAHITGLQKEKFQLHGIFACSFFFSFFAKLEEFSSKKHSSNEENQDFITI